MKNLYSPKEISDNVMFITHRRITDLREKGLIAPEYTSTGRGVANLYAINEIVLMVLIIIIRPFYAGQINRLKGLISFIKKNPQEKYLTIRLAYFSDTVFNMESLRRGVLKDLESCE